MTTAFIDTSAWIALLVRRDSHHAEARRFFQSIIASTRLVSSNYVLAESLTHLAYNRWRDPAIELHSMTEAAIRTRLLTLEWVDAAVHDAAWRIFEQYSDHVFSFCDCTSFALCRSRDIDFVFSFDRDFDVVGLDRRPRT